jgi:hypothetical protein
MRIADPEKPQRVYVEEDVSDETYYELVETLVPGGGQGGQQVSENMRLFNTAVSATRIILQGDNPCSQFFKGAGVTALGFIEKAVKAQGNSAFVGMMKDTGGADVDKGIRMEPH